MKKGIYILSMLAATLLWASCSSSDSVVEAVEDSSSDGTTSYMSVSIALTDGTSTRASGLEYSSSTEDYIDAESSIFLFYDDNGNYITYGYLHSSNNEWEEKDGAEVSYTTTTVALGPTYTMPTKVLAILNYDGDRDDLRGKSMSDIYSATRSAIPSTSGDFLMANALRVNVTGQDPFMYAVDIADENLCTSVSAAQACPVEIYVERQIAKASIIANTTGGSITYDSDNKEYSVTVDSIIYVDDTGYYDCATFKIIVDGWNINATNKSSYIIKNYKTDWETADETKVSSDYYSEWYDDSNETNRFYWAYDYNYDKDECIDDSIIYLSWNEVNTCSTDPIYVHENTANLEAQSDPHNVAGGQVCVPTLLLSAHIAIDKTGDGTYDVILYDNAPESSDEDTEFEFDKENALYYCAGVYYSYSAFLAKIADIFNNDEGYSWTDGSEILAEEITLTFEDGEIIGIGITYNSSLHETTEEAKAITRADEESAGGTVTESDNSTADADVTIINLTDSEGNTITELNVDDYSILGAKIYSYGMCYYQTPIIHFKANTFNGEETTFYGMVRNHYYSILLNSITGVGGPIYNPDDGLDEIPDKETQYYIGATLNILKWRAVTTQEVNF